MQTRLFPHETEIELALGGRLHREPFYSQAEAAETMAHLLAEVSLDQYEIQLFGKRVLQPRLVGWASDLTYRYSGFTLPPRPTGPVTARVLEAVNGRLAELSPSAPPFNHVLFNHYRDGRDGMGLHSDDEPELGDSPWIGSLSLGATRTFVVRPKKRHQKAERSSDVSRERHTLHLDSGSLLLMEPPMQKHYLHGLPKVAGVVQQRLNLTFRHVRA